MALYREYTLDGEHGSGPPWILECADDREAVSQARQYLESKPIEIWLEKQRVGRLVRG